MSDRPWPVTIVAVFLIVAGALVLGALWSESPGGLAFAQAATSAYESSWLPWACGVVGAGCGVGMLFGWPFSRLLVVIWMAYGVIEGLFLLDEPHYSLPVIGVYAAIAVALFLPQSNDWFRSGRAAAA
jgi:hypothetical protein